MDADRFDHLSRSLGNRTSRRRAALMLGGGGIFAATLAGLGLSRAKSSAQDNGETCCCGSCALDEVLGVGLCV